MDATTQNFIKLHQKSSPLLIANVWDVSSAVTAEKLGFQAIGTSSAAIANCLGYDDGERLSFDELLYIVGRIKAKTEIPLSVDLEAGYGSDVKQIINHIQQLTELGVVGINLEDSVCQINRQLVKTENFADKLRQIKIACGQTVFINVRTDAFLLSLPNALEETLYRLKYYETTGIDGLFVPGAINTVEIKQICQATHLPINTMCMPDLSDFQTLQSAGVQRISMGNFVHDYLQRCFSNALQSIIEQQSEAKRPADPVGWRRAGNEQMTVLPKAKKSSVNAVARQSEGRAFNSKPSCEADFHTQYERREARHLFNLLFKR